MLTPYLLKNTRQTQGGVSLEILHNGNVTMLDRDMSSSGTSNKCRFSINQSEVSGLL